MKVYMIFIIHINHTFTFIHTLIYLFIFRDDSLFLIYIPHARHALMSCLAFFILIIVYYNYDRD